jgi:hypothetical protein
LVSSELEDFLTFISPFPLSFGTLAPYLASVVFLRVFLGLVNADPDSNSVLNPVLNPDPAHKFLKLITSRVAGLVRSIPKFVRSLFFY